MPATLQPGQARVTHIVPDAYSGPSEGGPEESSSGGGIGGFLTAPLGPLPIWVWLIAGAGLTILFIRRKNSGVSNSVQTGVQPIDPNAYNPYAAAASAQASQNAADSAALRQAIEDLKNSINQSKDSSTTKMGKVPSRLPQSTPNPNRNDDKAPPKTGGPGTPVAPHVAASRYKPSLLPLYANTFSQPGGPGYSPLLGHRGIPAHRGVSMSQVITSDEPSNLAGRPARASFQDRPAVTARQPMGHGDYLGTMFSGPNLRRRPKPGYINPPIPGQDPNNNLWKLQARKVA